jgi:WD40 repeat protein
MSKKLTRRDFLRLSNLTLGSSLLASCRAPFGIGDIRPEGIGEGVIFVKGQPTKPEWSPGSSLSPDGSRLATTNADLTPMVWDTHSGDLVLTLPGHEDRVQKIEYSPDGSRLVTTGHDNVIKGWDATNGSELFSLSGFDCSTSIGISCDIAFSPDGDPLAIVDNSGILKVFEVSALVDLGAGTIPPEILTVSAHDDWIWDVVYNSDGKGIITTGRDKAAKIWNAETGTLLNTMSGHEGWVYGVTCSSDGKLIATTSSDGTVRVWDMQTGDWVLTLSGHTASVLQAAFSPDSTMIATASSDQTVKLWATETGQEMLTLYGHAGCVTDLAFSPDGKRLYTISRDGTDRVYLLNINELITLAKKRLIRWFSDEECYQYLQLAECPIW